MAVGGIAHTYPPGLARRCLTGQPDVAAAIDRVIVAAGVAQHLAGSLDRPALHQSGRVERAVPQRGEVAVRLALHEGAQIEDFGHGRGGFFKRDLAAT